MTASIAATVLRAEVCCGFMSPDFASHRPSQKSHLQSALNCATGFVDSGMSSTRYWPDSSAVNLGHGEFPEPFGFPVFAKLVQAATI